MSNKLVITEPVFIEDDGKPIAVILPIEMYNALRAHSKDISQMHGTQPEFELVEPIDEQQSAFERERQAFERLKPELMKRYPEKVVAIVGGEVVEVADDKLEVYDRVVQRFGNVSMYIQKVTDQPHVYKIPYRKVIKT